MMRAGLREDPVLREAVKRIRAHYGERVERIVLFGSRARGDHGPESDYDVAVFLKDLGSRKDEKEPLFAIKWQLLEATGKTVNFLPLSPIDRRGTQLLQYDIDHEGVAL